MKISIAIPAYDRKVDVEIMTAIARLPGEYPDMQWGLDWISTSIITAARNGLTERFLETECDYLYFWDSDVVIRDLSFMGKLLETATKLDAQIVGGVYRIKHRSSDCVVGMLKDDGEIRNFKEGEITEPRLVDVIGTGSMLIKREVFEKVPKPWFSFVDKPDLHNLPEDYHFCLLAKKQGIRVAVDPRFSTYHYGSAYWEHSLREKTPS